MFTSEARCPGIAARPDTWSSEHRAYNVGSAIENPLVRPPHHPPCSPRASDSTESLKILRCVSQLSMQRTDIQTDATWHDACPSAASAVISNLHSLITIATDRSVASFLLYFLHHCGLLSSPRLASPSRIHGLSWCYRRIHPMPPRVAVHPPGSEGSPGCRSLLSDFL